MILDGFPDQKIANIFGVKDTAITCIRLGKTWTHVPRPPELTNGRINLTKELVVEILQLIDQQLDDLTIAKKI